MKKTIIPILIAAPLLFAACGGSEAETEVKVDDVHAIRGTVSNESLLQIADAIFKNKSVEAINVLDELVAIGKESQRLVENLIKFYRDLLIFKKSFGNRGIILPESKTDINFSFLK